MAGRCFGRRARYSALLAAPLVTAVCLLVLLLQDTRQDAEHSSSGEPRHFRSAVTLQHSAPMIPPVLQESRPQPATLRPTHIYVLPPGPPRPWSEHPVRFERFFRSWQAMVDCCIG